ncbi:MAG: hypothetical protein EA428_01335 [Spirochaetaceae bacterium]|nr:MAG: hypothetical protein EA428_01335 [Spirochaetaceae bacterium]
MIPASLPLLILLFGTLFYLVIPGIGAFAVRKQWRVFRRRVLTRASFPLLSYKGVREQEGSGKQIIGSYRFFGALEAIEDDNIIWLRNGSLSVAVEMRDVRLYMLPTEDFGVTVDGAGGQLPDRTPSVLRWQRMTSLTEGSKIFVAGTVVRKAGRAVFLATRSDPLLVVMYDGPDETVVRRAIWCGRQRNEYWNQLTPLSLAGGILSLTVLAYLAIRPPVHSFPALLASIGALLPVLPLAPPGVALFFVYRHLWKEGRYRRARRDLEILEDGGSLDAQSARQAGRAAALFELFSLVCLITGLLINVVIALAVMSYFFP